jgi:hypothetical protein
MPTSKKRVEGFKGRSQINVIKLQKQCQTIAVKMGHDGRK